jgi:FlaA1/EpsC-like NDP-sugar epimerase
MFNNKVLLITGGTGSFGELSWIACCQLIFAKSAFSVAIKKSRTTCLDIEGMKRLLLKLDFIQKVNRAESALIEA